ncbi:hypothetical protein J3R30DRAFT_3713484 [Lentinula aciculospora]|uniref:Uncharacterized protein n=1 Tax=Lentinula aciculospora TaxID=153920 RepID=A0A9W8ZZS6_9AGAR|nr:hypothetical protein J3R30DRAFT_3713484 [Lentinula aciculospora]
MVSLLGIKGTSPEINRKPFHIANSGQFRFYLGICNVEDAQLLHRNILDVWAMFQDVKYGYGGDIVHDKVCDGRSVVLEAQKQPTTSVDITLHQFRKVNLSNNQP